MKRKTTVSPPSKPAASPHVEKALGYCRDAIAGKFPVSKWAVLACKRHLRDLERAETDAYPFRFDAEKAERVCRFVEMLPHVKGKWARRDPLNPGANRIRLEPWQCFLLCSIFGWVVKATGLRRFQRATVFVPRKNAKSTIVAAVGWWMFAKDGEPGAEVYCGAGTEKQAWEVFGIAHQFSKAEPRLAAELGVTVNARSLIQQSSIGLSKFEPVIGKPGDGASPHCAIIDEYHEHPTSEQFDTFKTGMGAREQPLLFVISTAGLNIAGPCRDLWNDCEKLLQGTIEEERHFALLYQIDEIDRWHDEQQLRAANPNWGVSVLPDTILPDRDKALRDARAQGAFKTKHGNIWVTANMAFFNLEHWRKCRDDSKKLDDMRGAACVIAGDLSSKVDLAALAYVFPEDGGRLRYFARYYLPEERVNLSENQHFRKWAAEGWLTVTPGNIIDFGQIRDDILADCARFNVAEIPLDPWQATMLITELNGQGAKAYEFRQTVQTMSEPMKQLDALMRAGKVRHDGNPVTEWCLSNVVAYLDAKENVYPRKERPELKIDGAVAAIMGTARAQLQEAAQSPGVLFV